MPSITIREIDNTSPGVLLSAEDVVFVPGFVNIDCLFDTAQDAYVPTLCETMQEFESYFGTIPAQFKEDQPYPSGFSADAIGDATKMFEANTMDPGYIYAKELINAGIPVLFVRCNVTEEDVTVAHMYDLLAGLTDYDVWADLKDIGEFSEVKFITSGGYPTFEFDMLDINFDTSGVVVLSCDTTTLVDALGGREEAKIVEFNYAEKVVVVTELPESPISGKEDYLYEVKSTMIDHYLWKDDHWETASDISTYLVWTITINGTKSPEPVAVARYGITIYPAALEVGAVIKTYVKAETDGTSYIAEKMLDLANYRGDCVALIDHTDNPDRPLNPVNSKSVFYSISNINSSFSIKNKGEFGAMFTPWCTYSLVTDLYNVLNNGTGAAPKAILPSYMPASFGYLKAYAEAIKTSANWLAVAGAARGAVAIGHPHLSSGLRLTNAIADAYQERTGIAINPITNIKPYGYLIWGNRTLKNNAENLTATSFLNTRNLVSEVKKLAYRSAKKCMFEQNSDVLWINFKSLITPTLDGMITGQGLSGYKLIQGTTTEKAKLVCTIRLYPIYAVESFDITVELADDEVTVS